MQDLRKQLDEQGWPVAGTKVRLTRSENAGRPGIVKAVVGPNEASGWQKMLQVYLPQCKVTRTFPLQGKQVTKQYNVKARTVLLSPGSWEVLMDPADEPTKQ